MTYHCPSACQTGEGDLEEEGGGRLHRVLVEDDERDEVADEAEDADEAVRHVDDELVQQAPGDHPVRRRGGRDVVDDVIAAADDDVEERRRRRSRPVGVVGHRRTHLPRARRLCRCPATHRRNDCYAVYLGSVAPPGFCSRGGK